MLIFSKRLQNEKKKKSRTFKLTFTFMSVHESKIYGRFVAFSDDINFLKLNYFIYFTWKFIVLRFKKKNGTFVAFLDNINFWKRIIPTLALIENFVFYYIFVAFSDDIENILLYDLKKKLLLWHQLFKNFTWKFLVRRFNEKNMGDLLPFQATSTFKKIIISNMTREFLVLHFNEKKILTMSEFCLT